MLDPLEPARVGGIADLDRALARLSRHERLLIIAAHPDDEDTTLLSYVARARGGEAAYLSLTRGDGGQNLIGDELGIGLGLLRSRELQEARRIDGARQFFTRAFDFGYTRSLDEALRRWPLEALVGDSLRVVQRFKPQVIVAIFPPDERAGHGQHQASAVVARQVFDLTQNSDGWRPASFRRAAFFLRGDEPPTVSLPLGTLEPFTGKSIFQIAMESRSNHRCQDMGLLQPLGDAEGRLAWVAGTRAVAGEGDQLFGGLDTSLSAMADPLADAELRRQVAEQLDAAQTVAERARSELTAVGLGSAGRAALARRLDQIVGHLEGAGLLVALAAQGNAAASDGADPGLRVVAELVGEKLRIAREAQAMAHGVAVEAYTETETVVAGDTLDVHVQVWSSTGDDVLVHEVVLFDADDRAWPAEADLDPEPASGFFRAEVDDHRLLSARVPSDAAATVPYFLEQPLDGDLFDWRGVAEAVRGEPFGPATLRASFHVELADGTRLLLDRDVAFRFRDQARGEVRKPLRIVPAVEVSLSDDLRLVSTSSGAASDPEAVVVTVQSNVDRPLDGEVEMRFEPDASSPDASAPDPSAASWSEPQTHPLSLEPEGRVHLRVELPKGDLAPGRYRVAASFAVLDPSSMDLSSMDPSSTAAGTFDGALHVIDYPHIDPVALPVPATLDLVAADLVLPDVDRVGYVRGASDRVPEMLIELGLPIEVLSAEQLIDADLSVYDALVVGSRAYEVEPALARANHRLLRYAESGGLVIVQYQQYQFVQGGFAPYPLDIRRPHDRVTDETAEVRMLAPDHPIFTTPHHLGDADWQGWVQERGLYFAGTWDEAYTPLLAMADPGRDENRGALLVADIGDGRYVYTGLAFFRQLPAGVPGAYRLFLNLLAWGRVDIR